MNTGKATINVINIVPKKKTSGNQNSIGSYNSETSNPLAQGLTMLNDTTNQENVNCIKGNSFKNPFDIGKQV